jgi:orotidine-5'-phosphate decarboxylase
MLSNEVGEGKRHESDFRNLIESASSRTRSNAVLALDLDFRKDTSSLLSDAMRIFDATKDFICAVKLNFHLIISLSSKELAEFGRVAASSRLPLIADVKLNDIDNTNRVAAEYLWSSGFSAVIVNPFVGFEGGLDVVFKRARELGKGIITLAYMSHKGADEGYGLELKDGRTIFELFLDRAINWQADGIIMGTTRAEKIAYARKKIPRTIKIFSPGSGAQGGSATESFLAGSDYLIYGRAIVNSPDPRKAAEEIYSTMLPLIEKRLHREEHS